MDGPYQRQFIRPPGEPYGRCSICKIEIWGGGEPVCDDCDEHAERCDLCWSAVPTGEYVDNFGDAVRACVECYDVMRSEK